MSMWGIELKIIGALQTCDNKQRGTKMIKRYENHHQAIKITLHI